MTPSKFLLYATIAAAAVGPVNAQAQSILPRADRSTHSTRMYEGRSVRGTELHGDASRHDPILGWKRAGGGGGSGGGGGH